MYISHTSTGSYTNRYLFIFSANIQINIQLTNFITIVSMELKEHYKNGCTCKTKLFGVVKVVNDEKMFNTYKKMGLDVFKNDEDIEQEKEKAKAIKDAERIDEQRIKDRAKYQKEKREKEAKIKKDLKDADKANKKKREEKW